MNTNLLKSIPDRPRSHPALTALLLEAANTLQNLARQPKPKPAPCTSTSPSTQP